MLSKTKMESSSKRQRISVKLKCPNPLFEKWLTEWRDEAKEKESKMQYCFSIALQSLKKYPLPLQTGRECKVLRGFGDKLCDMLDKKLQKYKLDNPSLISNETLVFTSGIDNFSDGSFTKKQVSKNPLESISGSTKEYIPQYRSGPYGILTGLYKMSLEANYQGFSGKSDLIKIAQDFCDTSFTKPDSGSRYTAWSSMRTLLTKNLVRKEGNPARFSLTDDGTILACRLYTARNDFDSLQKKENATSFSTELNPCSAKLTSNAKQQDQETNFPSSSGIRTSFSKYRSESDIMSGSCNNKTSNLILNRHNSDKPHLKPACSSQSSYDSQEQETVFLLPNSFEIILLVDTQETSRVVNRRTMDLLATELLTCGVEFERRNLKIGDYAWICRDRTSTNIELTLPYIVERKRMDDFGRSITDGRFHEQKFRLKRSGIQNLVYLIEKYGNNECVGLPINNLYQAAVNTLVQDKFSVKFTDSLRGTAEYLSCFTKTLKSIYLKKTLMSCPKENLTNIAIEDDLIPLMTFKEFNKSSSKSKAFKVKDMFIRHLLQIKGMSIDRAVAIVEKYPTPKHLKLAFEEKTAAEGEKMLSPIQFGKFKKNIGPVLSKIVYQLYSLKIF